jgi:hypothetical protein
LLRAADVEEKGRTSMSTGTCPLVSSCAHARPYACASVFAWSMSTSRALAVRSVGCCICCRTFAHVPASNGWMEESQSYLESKSDGGSSVDDHQVRGPRVDVHVCVDACVAFSRCHYCGLYHLRGVIVLATDMSLTDHSPSGLSLRLS